MAGAMNVRQKLKRGRPLTGHSNVAPTISIDGSSPGAVMAGVPTSGFSATVYDAEQGDISSQVVWSIPTSASPAGTQVLGVGSPVALTFPNAGVVTLTATITDSYGATAQDTTPVSVSV